MNTLDGVHLDPRIGPQRTVRRVTDNAAAPILRRASGGAVLRDRPLQIAWDPSIGAYRIALPSPGVIPGGVHR
jgi:hypothetical protein